MGAAQVREAVLGDVNRAPTPEELEKMKALVAQAMEQGALGISTALIYPPGHYAKTEELIELAKVAARYGGFMPRTCAVKDRMKLRQCASIAYRRGSPSPVEIFHLKVSGNRVRAKWLISCA